MQIANVDKLDRLKEGGATANGAVSAAVRVLGGLLLLITGNLTTVSRVS